MCFPPFDSEDDVKNTFFVAQLATPLKSQTRLWRWPIASIATCWEVLHQRLQIAVEHLDLEARIQDLLCWCFECVNCVKCWCKRRRHMCINVNIIYAMFCIYSNIFYFLVYIWHFHICFSFSPLHIPTTNGARELRDRSTNLGSHLGKQTVHQVVQSTLRAAVSFGGRVEPLGIENCGFLLPVIKWSYFIAPIRSYTLVTGV